MDGKRYAVDTRTEKLGQVGEVDPPGTAWLRPPGGGSEWDCPEELLREPDAAELARAETYSSPVGSRQ